MLLIWQTGLSKWKEMEMRMERTEELVKLEELHRKKRAQRGKNKKGGRQILKSKGMKAIGSGQEGKKHCLCYEHIVLCPS